jgi:hypothetical protein
MTICNQTTHERSSLKFNLTTSVTAGHLESAPISSRIAPRIHGAREVMFESKPPPSAEDVETIASRGPRGAIALCAIAVALVIAIWFAFYLFAFRPRGFTR